MEAFNTLSRQHFEIQTWRGVPADGAPTGVFSFLVRNLSVTNQVNVSSGPPDGIEDAMSKLAQFDHKHLLDGDWISLNLNQDHAFHLVFRDLTKSTSMRLGLPGAPALECHLASPAPSDVTDDYERNYVKSSNLSEGAALGRRTEWAEEDASTTATLTRT